MSVRSSGRSVGTVARRLEREHHRSSTSRHSLRLILTHEAYVCQYVVHIQYIHEVTTPMRYNLSINSCADFTLSYAN